MLTAVIALDPGSQHHHLAGGRFMGSPTNHRIVTTMAIGEDHRGACLRISGDVDIDSEGQLAALRQTIVESKPASLYIDLDQVTFAGTTLLHFVEDLCDQLPVEVAVVLCRPSTFLKELLELVHLDDIVGVQAALPPAWTSPMTHSMQGHEVSG
jgi:anti-anti-sigma regulatory factor